MQNAVKLALALALTGFFASATVARADDDGGDKNKAGSASEAPLPLLGATPFAFAALGGGLVFILRRRRSVSA